MTDDEYFEEMKGNVDNVSEEDIDFFFDMGEKYKNGKRIAIDSKFIDDLCKKMKW